MADLVANVALGDVLNVLVACGTVGAALVAAFALKASARAAAATERQVEAQTTPLLVEVGRGPHDERGPAELLSSRTTGDISIPTGYTIVSAQDNAP